jgi:hypothetical protein
MDTRYPIPQAAILAEFDITEQALRNWRLGHRKGKYVYKATLVWPDDWDKIGPAIIYTQAGRKKIAGMAEKREEAPE